MLHVLSPTDVVRDRFLHFYAWSDPSAYVSAATIGRAIYDLVDWAVFEDWARREAAADAPTTSGDWSDSYETYGGEAERAAQR